MSDRESLSLREVLGNFVAVERISTEDLKVTFEVVSSSVRQDF
jgi:hypothetical protein